MGNLPTDIEIASMISQLKEDHRSVLKLVYGKIVPPNIRTTVGDAADMLSAILHGRSQVKAALGSDIVTDEELADNILRKDLNSAVIKIASGYSNGSTVNYCLENLGLIKVGRGGKVLGLSQRGREYLNTLMDTSVLGFE